jgi:hypothetical protein
VAQQEILLNLQNFATKTLNHKDAPKKEDTKLGVP